LNHNGGQGSGTFDDTWGNSLSYASPDGTTGSASPQTLADQMLDDNIEIVVMSDQPCNNDCGTVRPGTVAYHGFDGASKVFLMEFGMPSTGKNGVRLSQAVLIKFETDIKQFNLDMPAIWTLNAQIPRTLQYGAAECSCWESGCGEWDIFEVLDSGNFRAKSTYHGNPAGGDPNYFQRPTNGTMKAAVIFDGTTSTSHIVILPDSTIFSATLANTVVSGFVNSVNSSPLKVVFDLAS